MVADGLLLGRRGQDELRHGSRFGPEDDLLELGDEIGSGMAARVYLCSRVRTGEQLAVKVMNLQKLRLLGDFEAQLAKLDREVQILRELQHPRIVRLHNVYRTDNSVFLIMELVTGGELFDYIVQNKRLTEVEARHVFKQVLEGVGYMHTRNVIHRDLKPENILIASAREAEAPLRGSLFEVKIADFGLSKIISEETSRAKTFVGTPQYWAPEVLAVQNSGGTYTKAVDYWSLGAVLFVMLCGRYPFDGKKMPLDEQIRSAAYNMGTKAWQEVSEEAKGMVRGLLKVNPEERFNLEACRSHPWLCPEPSPTLALSPGSSGSSPVAQAVAFAVTAADTPEHAGGRPHSLSGPMITEVSGGSPTTGGVPLVSHPSNSSEVSSHSGDKVRTPMLSQETPNKIETAASPPKVQVPSIQVGGASVGGAPHGAYPDTSQQSETIFCLNELLKLQVSIAGSLEMAALAFRHSDVELSEAIRQTFWQARDLSSRGVKVISQYAQVAEQVSRDVLPDLELAVQEKEPSLAVDLLGMVKEWVVNMKNDGQEIQRLYHGLQASVHNLIQRAQLAKHGADRRLAECVQGETASMIDGSPRPQPTAHLALSGPVAGNPSVAHVASINSGAASPSMPGTTPLNHAMSFSPVGAEDGHAGCSAMPFSMNAWTRQLFDQLSTAQGPRAIEDQSMSHSDMAAIGSQGGDAPGPQFTNTDSEAWKRDVLELLFLTPGFLPTTQVTKAPPQHPGSAAADDAVMSRAGEDVDDHAAQPQISDGALVRYEGPPRASADLSAAASSSPAGGGGGLGDPSTSLEAVAGSSGALLRALRELKRVDEILDGCSAFWANMDGTVQKLAQMKDHTERLVNYAANSKPLRDRFEQRLGEYTSFWSGLECLCRQYCLDHQASAKRMYEVIREVSDTTDVVDTAQSARMGYNLSVMREKQRRQGWSC